MSIKQTKPSAGPKSYIVVADSDFPPNPDGLDWYSTVFGRILQSKSGENTTSVFSTLKELYKNQMGLVIRFQFFANAVVWFMLFAALMFYVFGEFEYIEFGTTIKIPIMKLELILTIFMNIMIFFVIPQLYLFVSPVINPTVGSKYFKFSAFFIWADIIMAILYAIFKITMLVIRFAYLVRDCNTYFEGIACEAHTKALLWVGSWFMVAELIALVAYIGLVIMWMFFKNKFSPMIMNPLTGMFLNLRKWLAKESPLVEQTEVQKDIYKLMDHYKYAKLCMKLNSSSVKATAPVMDQELKESEKFNPENSSVNSLYVKE